MAETVKYFHCGSVELHSAVLVSFAETFKLLVLGERISNTTAIVQLLSYIVVNLTTIIVVMLPLSLCFYYRDAGSANLERVA